MVLPCSNMFKSYSLRLSLSLNHGLEGSNSCAPLTLTTAMTFLSVLFHSSYSSLYPSVSLSGNILPARHRHDSHSKSLPVSVQVSPSLRRLPLSDYLNQEPPVLLIPLMLMYFIFLHSTTVNHTYLPIYIYLLIYTCLSMYVSVYISIYLSLYIYLYLYLPIYIIYLYIYMDIYLHHLKQHQKVNSIRTGTLFYSLIYPQHLKKNLVHNKYSITTCCINE